MNDYDPNYVHVPAYFLLGVKVIIINDNNEVLLLRRSSKTRRSGGWDLPGGAIDQGEGPVEAATREVKEETGLEVEEINFISAHLADTPVDQPDVLIIGFTATVSHWEVSLSWEHDSLEWIKLEEAVNLELPRTHKSILNEYMKNR